MFFQQPGLFFPYQTAAEVSPVFIPQVFEQFTGSNVFPYQTKTGMTALLSSSVEKSNGSSVLELSVMPTFLERVRYSNTSISHSEIEIKSRTLYIGGIHSTVSMELIKALFSSFNVETITIQRRFHQAFVKLHTRLDAENALTQLKNSKLNGVSLNV